MATEAGYEILQSDTKKPLTIPNQDSVSNESPIDEDQDEKLIEYREAGPSTLDLPQALLDCVKFDRPVQYKDLISHGADEEERGGNAYVVTPLALQITIDENDQEIQELLLSIQDFSRSRLWKFNNLPILPPESQLRERLFPDETEAEHIQPFIAPDPNELRELAVDSDGSPRRLNADQLRGIRQDGAFEVPSRNFPGAVHVWRISQVLQRGRQLANDDLKYLLSIAYKVTFIIARDRVIGDSFSLKDVAKHLGYSIHFLYNLAIGAQIRHPKFDRNKEMLKALTRSLKTDHMANVTKSQRIEMMRGDSYRAFRSKRSLKADQVANVYTNSEGLNLNIFAVSSCWLTSLNTQVLSQVYTKAKDSTREKFPPQLIKQLIVEYQEQGMSNEEVKKAIQDRFDLEFLNNLIESIKEHPDINSVIPLGQGGVIDSYFKGLKAVHVAIKEEKKRVEGVVKCRKEHLMKHCSIRSKCESWFEKQIIEATNSAFVRENTFENIRQKISSYPDIGPEWEYFINICEDFYNHLPQTIERVHGRDYGVEKFTFAKIIWNPKNYIVTNASTGERKKNVRIQSQGTRKDSSYLVQHYEECVVTTKYPGWRWRTFFVSFYTWYLNLFYIILIFLVLKGPFSVGGLFLWYEHPIKYSVDWKTGNVYPSKREKTLVTRLVSLWGSILERRREFESRPDTGFLPKNFTRFLNRIYYYVIWGVIGSILLVISFITISILSINSGLILIVTLPLWYTLYYMLKVVTRWLFYDWEGKFKIKMQGYKYGYIMPLFYLVFYELLVRVFLQFVFVVPVIVALPFVSLTIILWAVSRRILRLVWDSFTYYLVIRLRGRVPEADSLLARRVSGPGLATNYFYRIDPNQALIKFEYDLESEELKLYEEFITSLVDQPRKMYVQFIQSILKPFGYSQTNQTDAVTLVDILSQKSKLLNELKENLKTRKQSFKLKQPDVNLGSIRMNKEDLELTVEVATILIEEFYTKRISSYPNHDFEGVFSAVGLVNGDWESLAKIELTKSFSPKFLTHLEDSDENFNLQVNKFGVHKYFKNLRYGKTAHDLDRERLILVERGATYLPSISLSPSFDKDWAIKGCTSIYAKYHPGTNIKEELFFPTHFNDKVEIFMMVGGRIGWDNILVEIPESTETSTAESQDAMDVVYSPFMV